MSPSNSLFFRVDEGDVIVDIGGEWDNFARDNEGANIFRSQVLGTKLYQHIKGETCRTYVWTVLDAVRKLEKPITRSYRCDSPTCKRFMTMSVSPEPHNFLLLEHRLMSTEAFKQTLRFTFASKGAQTKLTRCSMCNRLQVNGVWGEPERMLAHPPKTASTLVIYSVCQDCRTEAAIPQHFA